MTKSVTFTEPAREFLIPVSEKIAIEAGFKVLPPQAATFRTPEEAREVVGARVVIDPSELIILEADLLNDEELANASAALIADGIFAKEDWPSRYSEAAGDLDKVRRAGVKFGWAVEQAARIVCAAPGACGYEIVFNAPTAVNGVEHLFIGRELMARGVSNFSLQLSWPGRWEPAVEWIGELEEFRAVMTQHADIAQKSGGWQMSFDHAEQKFSVLPILAEVGGENFHLHLDGIHWNEAMRVFARHEPELFRMLLPTAQERFVFEKPREGLSTNEDDLRVLPEVPDSQLEAVFVEDYRGRQMLHVTAGSLLRTNGHGPAIREGLARNADVFAQLVEARLRAHFAPWLPR